MGLVSPGGAGGADNVAIADGSDVNAGATTDAAITTNTTGTVSGKLRGIVAILAAGIPTIGQKAMAGSQPVTIASDQSAVATAPAQATAANLNAQVVGTVASGAADSGNPVKAGAVFNTTPPTLTNAQRGDLQQDARGSLAVTVKDNAGTTGMAVQSLADNRTGNAATTLAYQYQYAPGGSGGEDRVRAPTIFKTATATASGDTAVWTPTSGKKFRLMSYAIYVTANAAQSVAGLIEILLRDATTAIGVGYSCFVPGAAGTTFVDSSESGWVQLGNGFLSGAADRVLNVNLSASFTAGEVRVVVCGTEE